MLLRHRPNRLIRNVFVACAAGTIGLLLASCSVFGSVFGFGGTDPHLYDTVDAVVAELDLESVGEVIYEGHYGTGKFSSSPPTAELIIELRTSPQVIHQAISDAGFAKDTLTSWKRGSGDSLISVGVLIVDAGEVVATGDGTEVKLNTESALIDVTSFG